MKTTSLQFYTMAVSLLFGFSAQAQTYTGEAVFADESFTQTTFPTDPDGGGQIEVTCMGTSSLSFSNMIVELDLPSMSFNWDAQNTDVTGTDNRFCLDSQFSFPFQVANVAVTESGVIGQNSTGSLTIELFFSGDGSRLDGTVTVIGGSPSPRIGFASLALPSAENLLSNLIAVVVELNLKGGLNNAFDSKLQNALAALDRAQAGDNNSAIGILSAFIQSVEAQRGKAISGADADTLVSSAQAIIDALM